MKQSLRLLLVTALTAVLVATPVLAATIEESQRPYLTLVRALQAQTISKGEGVTVAVLDTGVDSGHPDLAAAMVPGYHVDRKSVSAANGDLDGHGTAMAGIIAGRGGGYNNVLGIAPRAKIMPVGMEFIGGDPSASISAAIRWAVDHGAKVLNMSVARPAYGGLSRAEAEAMAYAHSKDVVVFVSAGNVKDATGGNELAKLPGVVAVAATTQSGAAYSGSEVRDYNAIAAPGEKIVTTGARNVHLTGFVSDSGTSPATAVVAGVAALIRAKYPDMSAANVINRVIKTAVDKGEPGRDPVYGFGIVDAYAALTANVPEVSENPLGVIKLDTQATTNDKNQSKQRANAAILVVTAAVGLLPLLLLGLIILLVVRAIRRRRAADMPAYQPPPTPYTPQVTYNPPPQQLPQPPPGNPGQPVVGVPPAQPPQQPPSDKDIQFR
jgi:type VII secretion-associated serine protease mycosin